jgi:hypothetical protein
VKTPEATLAAVLAVENAKGGFFEQRRVGCSHRTARAVHRWQKRRGKATS